MRSTVFPLLTGTSAGPRFCMRDRAKVCVDRKNVAVGHIPKNLPGHHLQYLVRIVGVVAGSDQFEILFEVQSGRFSVRIRRYVGGDDRSEGDASSQVVCCVDLAITSPREQKVFLGKVDICRRKFV